MSKLGVPALRRRPELLLVAATALLYSWNLDANGRGNEYYAAAVRSMTRSWSNFFYAALDSGGWTTVDKPPAALWLQAVSARIFGFSPWALLLPSVVCGALAVWLLMSTVGRVWGRTAGLVAGGVLALTPMMLAVSRSNNPDVTLVLCVVAAAWATQRGIEDGRMRWMVWAGVFCGLGFLAKLLAAGLVMPGMWGAYLLAAPGNVRRRLLNCLVGAGAFFAVSLVWIGAVDLRPLTDRPWIGGSADGTARDLVFGYNGFGRVLGAHDSSGGPQMSGAAGAFLGGGGGIDQFGGPTGIGRLFNAGMGDQVMWLVPVAFAAAVVGLVDSIRRRRRDARLGSLVMWLGWSIVVYLLFAFAEGTFHNYYVSLLAPPLAALVGVGVELAARARSRGAVLAGIVVLGTAVLQVVFLRRVDALHWLRWVVPVGAVLATAAFVGLAVRSGDVRRRRLALAACGTVLLLAPAAWSVAGVRHPQNSTFPDARPVGSAPSTPGPGGGGGFGPGAPGGGSIDAREIAWLEAQRKGETWILGVSGSMQGSSSIADGHDVVALGGFMGSDNSASVSRVTAAVESGRLRYLSLGGGFGFGGSGALASAVSSACTDVAATTWGATGAGGVYDCAGKAAAIREAAKRSPAADNPGGGRLPGVPPDAGGLPAGGPGLPGDVDLPKVLSCMASKGFAQTGGRMPDLSDPKLKAALASCGLKLPEGFTLPAGFTPPGLTGPG